MRVMTSAFPGLGRNARRNWLASAPKLGDWTGGMMRFWGSDRVKSPGRNRPYAMMDSLKQSLAFIMVPSVERPPGSEESDPTSTVRESGVWKTQSAMLLRI